MIDLNRFRRTKGTFLPVYVKKNLTRFHKLLILFLLLFFPSTHIFSYPIIDLPEKTFDQPSALIDNTTRQLLINVFLDNTINQKTSTNEIVLKRDQSEFLYYTPLKTKFHSANVAFGIDTQKVVIRLAQPQNSSSINYVSEFSKSQIIYGKRINSTYGIGASVGIIEGRNKIDYAFEGIVNIDRDNKFVLNHSNVNLCSRFEFVYQSEKIEVPIDIKYSNTRFLIPLILSDKCSLLFNAKLTNFNSENRNITGYGIGMSGITNLIKVQSNYRLNRDTVLLVKFNQDIINSKLQFFSDNLRFGELNIDSYYYSLSFGRKKSSLCGRYSFFPNIVKHHFNINFSGFIESWPFTSLFTEIFGSGLVYNYSNKTLLDIYELQLNMASPLHKKLDFKIINSIFYINSEDGLTGIWKRKSSIIGLLEPGEYESIILPEELNDSFYGKISAKLSWEYKDIELVYSFGIFFAIRAGKEKKELFEIPEETKTTEIPGIHNLSIKVKF